MIYLPNNFDSNKTYPFVVYINGAGGRITDLQNEMNLHPVIRSLQNAGYIIIASAYTSNYNWGNEQALIDTKELIDYYESNYNLEPKPYVIAQSMGGMVMENAISQGYLSPKKVVAIYPVLELTEMHKGKYQKTIDEAYDGNFTKAPDPLKGDLKEFTMPFLIWASPSDTIVKKSLNTDVFASKVKATVIETVGEHGDPSNFDPEKIIEFFKAS